MTHLMQFSAWTVQYELLGSENFHFWFLTSGPDGLTYETIVSG